MTLSGGPADALCLVELRGFELPYLRTLGGHRRYPDQEIRTLLKTLSEPVDQSGGSAP
jgi:hypothetical protein